MIQLSKITCHDSNPSRMHIGQLTVTIFSFIAPGDYDTSIFTLDKNSGQLMFSHFYKDIVYGDGVRPQVTSGSSAPYVLSPAGQLYGIALSEMLDYAQSPLNFAPKTCDKQRKGAFVNSLKRFLPNQELAPAFLG